MELVLKKLAKKYGMEFHEETNTPLCYIDIALDKLVLSVVYYKKKIIHLYFVTVFVEKNTKILLEM